MHQEVPSKGDESVKNLHTETSSSCKTRLHPLPCKLDQDPLPSRGEPRIYDEEEEEEVVSLEHLSAMDVSSRQGTRLYNQVLRVGPSSLIMESSKS